MAFKILGRDGVQLTTAGATADNLSAEARRIVNVSDPVGAQDAATRAWVEAEIAAASSSSALDGTFRIKNTADNTKELAFDVSGVSPATTRTIIMPDADVDLGLVNTAIQSSEKGANNGVATLDAGGKIPVSQLPNSVMEYQGTWNASTNSPTLADGVGNTGDVYRVTVAGSQDLGSGSISFAVGDYAIYNGTAWEKADATDAVVSVNGQQGVVVLDTDDIAEGATNFYYTSARFDADFATKDTGDLAEGSNLYFTEARVLATDLAGFSVGANTAIVAADTILQAFGKTQGQINATNTAISDHLNDTTDAHDASAISNVPSGNLSATDQQSVNNELQSDIDTRALSSDLTAHINNTTDAHDASAISNVPSGNLSSTDQQGVNNELQGDIDALDTRLDTAEADIDTLQADSGKSFEAGVAGESMAADTLWLVRRAKNGETAGRYYKAQADSAINSRVVGYIMVGASGLSAGDPVRVYKLGSASLGSSDTPFGGTDINTPVYLHQSSAGKWTLSPSETAGSWIKEVGFVGTTGIIEFQPGILVQA